MKLFVGLGNPGRDYAKHRHNVGFMAVERIVDRHALGSWKSRFQGFVSDGRIAGERILVLKPETYMNESGRSVSEAARYLKIDPEDVIVFYDEIDLAAGKLKLKTGGGNAGHNGLRSITQHFGNDYQRVRIGVGRPQNKAQVANYVLSNFSKSDQVWLEPLLDEIAAAVSLLATDKSDQFLSTVIRALQPPEASKPKRKPQSDSTPQSAKSRTARDKATGAKASKGEKSSETSSLAAGLKSWLTKSPKSQND